MSLTWPNGSVLSAEASATAASTDQDVAGHPLVPCIALQSLPVRSPGLTTTSNIKYVADCANVDLAHLVA